MSNNQNNFSTAFLVCIGQGVLKFTYYNEFYPSQKINRPYRAQT